MGRLLAVLAACLLLAGCSPRPTRAVRLDGSGQLEIIDTVCDSRPVTEVEIRAMNDDEVVDERDQVLWRIGFARPTRLSTMTTGRLPEGAEEKVAWQQPAGDQRLDLFLYDGDLYEPGTDFTLDELKDGHVRLWDETLTAEQFERKRERC